MLRNLILLFAVVLAFPAHGQVRDVITGRYAPELDNFLLNTDCFANTRNISVTGTGTVTRTTSTPLRGVASCLIGSSAIGDKIIFALRPFDGYLKGRTCEMRFKYSGDASGYKTYAVRNSVTVSLETQLENTGSDSKELAFGLPCGDLTQATTIVFEATAAAAPAFKLGMGSVSEIREFDGVAAGGDALGWFVDVEIGGSSVFLGTVAVTSYTELTSSFLNMTINTANGSKSAKILCAGTQAPSGLTCAGAGVESLGVAVVIPREGKYEACASFTHTIITSSNANSLVRAGFQLVETPLNAQTILQEGGGKSLGGARSINATTGQESLIPHKTCSVLSFSTPGEKAIRLMYEQEYNNAPTSNYLNIGRSAASGQVGLNITVRPYVNIDKINGSLAQIDSALQTAITAPGTVKPKVCTYNFGGASATLAAPTVCGASPCVEVYDSCGAGTPPTRASSGNYDAFTLAAGTFKASTAIHCSCTAFSATDPRVCMMDNDTTQDTWSSSATGGYVADIVTTSSGGGSQDTFVTVRCEGQAP